MRDKQQWEQFMELIEKIEDKYGSIKLTPRSDPVFLKAKSMVAFGTHQNALDKLLPSKRGLITNYIKQGHSKKYIESHCHVTSSLLDMVCYSEGIEFIPRFLYVMHKDGEPDYYFRYKQVDVPKFFSRNPMTSRTLKDFIESSGWEIVCKKTIWKDIPIGSSYVTRNHEVLTKTTDEYEN